MLGNTLALQYAFPAAFPDCETELVLAVAVLFWETALVCFLVMALAKNWQSALV